MFPLGVLFGLNLVDEFDRSAFMALAPEIRDALGMSDAAIVSIGTLSFASVVFLSVPIGYLADRVSRVRISIAAATLWTVAAVATGLATTLTVLFAARCAAGSGRLVNDTIHPSLLSNYYPASSLPLVTAVHRSATHFGTLIAGPVVGIVAAALGWRSAFFLAAIPTVVLVLFALRLREPPRAEEALPPPHRFVAAFSELRHISTLRRIWAAAFLYGAAFIPFLVTLLALFFESEHGFGTEARGAVIGLFGLGGLVGVFVGWPAARRSGSFRPAWLAQLFGFSLALFGGAVIAMVNVSAVWAAVALSFGAAIAGSAYLPAYTTLVALITPPLLRSQGYTYIFFFYALGAIACSQVAARLATSAGIPTTCAVLGAVAIAAGAIAASASSTADADSIAPPQKERRGRPAT